MKVIIGIALCVPFLIWATGRTVKGITFNQRCGGHLALAAKANSIELAERELTIAVNYAEANDLTKGFTSVLYRTPDEDVGFWYKNMTTALSGLRGVSESPLERSNILLKLHETLVLGNELFIPEGISVFPSNPIWAFTGWATGLCLGGGIALIMSRLLEI